MYIYSKSVHTNACNKQSDVCYLSYFHVHTAINILRCFGYPREHNFGLVLILSPTGCTEGCVYFPQSCRNTHLPHFLDCLLNTTLIPCLLVCFLSILHERVCDYSGVQSSVTGILRMGDMNIHITWLTHVRTGPKKKNRGPTTCLEYLGIEIDTVALEMRLPPHKLERLWTTLQEWQGQKCCTKRDLQSLTGLLQHAATVVRPGRTFMRRMCDLLKLANKPGHHIRLNKGFRSDLAWWSTFAAE